MIYCLSWFEKFLETVMEDINRFFDKAVCTTESKLNTKTGVGKHISVDERMVTK